METPRNSHLKELSYHSVLQCAQFPVSPLGTRMILGRYLRTLAFDDSVRAKQYTVNGWMFWTSSPGTISPIVSHRVHNSVRPSLSLHKLRYLCLTTIVAGKQNNTSMNMNLKRSMPCKDLLGLTDLTSFKMRKMSGSDSCCSTSSESESESSFGSSLSDMMYKRPRLMCMPEVFLIKTPATAALEASLPLDDLDDDDEFLNFSSIIIEVDASKLHRIDSGDLTGQFSRLSTRSQSA